MKATEQCFSVVLFTVLFKVVLTFESVDEILKCDHLNESYWAVLFCGAVYCAVQGGSNFCVHGWNPKVWPFKWKLLSSTLIMLYKVVLTFESVGENLKCDYWNKCFPVALFFMLYKVVLLSPQLSVTFFLFFFFLQNSIWNFFSVLILSTCRSNRLKIIGRHRFSQIAW